MTRVHDHVLFRTNVHTEKTVSTSLHSFATALHSTREDNEDWAKTFFFSFLQVRKSPDGGRVGREIICCNCSSAGALLKDSYPRYGCWSALFQAAIVSSLLSLQLATVQVDVSYLCVSGSWNIIHHYLGLRCDVA